MAFPRSMSQMRHVRFLFLGCTVFLAACVAKAQSSSSQDPSTAGYSSSQAGLSASGLELTDYALPEAPDPAGSSAEGGAGQYGKGGGNGGAKNFVHNWTFELGGGFNAPVGNDTPYITWGGNFTGGAGFRFSDRLSVLAEYQFMDDKLPGGFISAVNTSCQQADCGVTITAGNAHMNSITGSPVIDLTPKWSNGVYVVGGFGWYHKSTNFQAPEEAFSPYYGYYYENVTATSFTSNQWGGNIGLGIYHRLGSMYGGDTHSQIFAEARYAYLHTPPITQNNGVGTTELIPVTIGVRF
jgi:hypothetical protein